MGGLKEIRTRISSIKTTRQVTGAMKMVSAARLKKAQDMILQGRPYMQKLHDVLKDVSVEFMDNSSIEYLQIREPIRILIVLITSNRGLCGAFNLNIAKKAIDLIGTKYKLQHQMEEVDFICIGKQGERLIKPIGLNIIETYHDITEKIDREQIFQLANDLTNKYLQKEYDRIELVYNQFLNAGSQLHKTELFLPYEFDDTKTSDHRHDYIFEQDRSEIILNLISKSLKLRMYSAILESYTAEQGARMTAMHQATDNANSLLNELSLYYNKLRQASITREILEIVGGAEALK